MTASAVASDMSAALAAGAYSYLTKPFSPREHLSRLDEALLLEAVDYPPIFPAHQAQLRVLHPVQRS